MLTDADQVTRRRSSTKLLVVLLLAIVAGLCLVQPWRWFFLRSYRFLGNSMAPTIVDGDHIVVDLLAYLHRSPSRGDVIAYVQTPPRTGVTIKRVIAVGGDEIHADKSGVWLNGQLQHEGYLHPGNEDMRSWGDPFDSVQVPANSLFVMGDNRNSSYDSRSFGCIPAQNVFARVEYVLWSKDGSRFFKSIR